MLIFLVFTSLINNCFNSPMMELFTLKCPLRCHTWVCCGRGPRRAPGADKHLPVTDFAPYVRYATLCISMLHSPSCAETDANCMFFCTSLRCHRKTSTSQITQYCTRVCTNVLIHILMEQRNTKSAKCSTQ